QVALVHLFQRFRRSLVELLARLRVHLGHASGPPGALRREHDAALGRAEFCRNRAVAASRSQRRVEREGLFTQFRVHATPRVDSTSAKLWPVLSSRASLPVAFCQRLIATSTK